MEMNESRKAILTMVHERGAIVLFRYRIPSGTWEDNGDDIDASSLFALTDWLWVEGEDSMMIHGELVRYKTRTSQWLIDERIECDDDWEYEGGVFRRYFLTDRALLAIAHEGEGGND